MISAGNIFNDLATALRRTMSPIRKRDANAASAATAGAAAEAAGEGPSDKRGGNRSSPPLTMDASGDVEGAKENVEMERKSPSSPAASAADHKARKTTKKRARFEPLPATATAAEAPSTAADSDRRTKSLRQRRRQSLAVGMESCGGGGRDLARTNSGGHGAPSPSSSSSHKRSRAAAAGQYKRRQSMAATVAAQAAALSGTSPHFHPDLTLEKLREMQTSAQQKKQASLEASLTPMQSLDFNDAQFLEINTMFDFHPVPGTSPPPKSTAVAAAVAVAAETTSKERPSRPRLRSGDEKQLEDKADQSAKVSWVPN